jgi:hypothetical protein
VRRAALVSALALSSCGAGVLKLGLRVKVDIFGAKAEVKLPLEFYPTLDGGYPPAEIVND